MKFCQLLDSIRHSPVLLIVFLDLVFLGLLFYVYRVDMPIDVRNVIKDAFIGWNGALALAINVSVKKEASLCDSSPPSPSRINE